MSRKIDCVINLVLIAAIAFSSRASAGKPAGSATVQFSKGNRDFVVRYAHEQKIDVLGAYKSLFEAAEVSSARDHTEVGFSTVAAVYAMRSKCRSEGVTPSESWRQVIDVLKTQGVINGGLLKGIGSSSAGDGTDGGGTDGGSDSGNDCGCPCEVFYKGSCGSNDCQLCQACCDTACDVKCASSSGCSDCNKEKQVEKY
jgi:hypothetical protein